jgi:hypothetical protein
MKRVTRAYSRLLDVIGKAQLWAQVRWQRFRKTELGGSLVWLAPRAVKAMWLVTKLAIAVGVAVAALMYGTMLFCLLVVTGNGKAATKSFTKITLVAVGAFAAVKLAKRPEVAKAIKAVTGAK